MRISISLDRSDDFGFEIVNRTKTELNNEESYQIWKCQNSTLKGTLDLVRWIMDNNDFNQYCEFYPKDTENNSAECFYLKIMRWANLQKMQNHQYAQYIFIPVFEDGEIAKFLGLFARCNLQHNRKRLTCYRFGNATIEPVDYQTKDTVLCQISAKSSDFMQRHERICSISIRPDKIVKAPERSTRLLTNYKRFDTIRVPKGTLTT